MRYYLAHPFDARHEIREWELATEVKYDIELVNPFYDVHRADVSAIDEGRHERYERLDPANIVKRDLDAIDDADGVIAFVDGSVSYGTPMEIMYSHCVHPDSTFIVCTNGHHDHPWLRYHSTRIFTSKQELEQYLETL
jgi:nucleoside 2-deoxyribosyltransferase